MERDGHCAGCLRQEERDAGLACLVSPHGRLRHPRVVKLHALCGAGEPGARLEAEPAFHVTLTDHYICGTSSL